MSQSNASTDMELMLSALGSPNIPNLQPYEHNDDAFFEQFEQSDIPVSYWQRHKSHIRMAYIYLTKFGYEEGLSRVRDAIKRYFTAQQIPNTLSTGYHETLTVVWMRLTNFILQNYGTAPNSLIFCDQHSSLMNSRNIELFYTHDHLYTEAAKQDFVDPNLMPLPQA